MIIYKVVNLINKKVYIGQTIKTLEQRKRNHLQSVKRGSEFYFHNAIRKYGVHNFKWEILEEVEDIKSLHLRETYWITYYESNDTTLGYNMTVGGIENPMNSEKIKQKHLEAVQSDKFKENLRKLWTGRKLSDNTKRKLSLTKLGSKNPMYGKRPANAKTVQMIDPSTLKVIRTFDSAHLAGAYVLNNKLSTSKHANINISSCARGKRKFSYGYIWKYVEKV